MSNGVRIKDVSRRAIGPQVEVAPVEAVELLLALCMLYGGDPDDSFDVGAAKVGEWRSGLSKDLDRAARELCGDADTVPSHLVGLAYEAPGEKTADDLLEHLGGLDPIEIKRTILGYYMQPRPPLEPEVIDRMISGDADARASILTLYDDYPEHSTAWGKLLDRDPPETKGLLLRVLSGLNEEFFAPRLDEVWPILVKDAEAKRERAKSVPVTRLVEETTGYRFTPDPDLRSVVVMPTFYLRPWMLISEHRDTVFFCYSASDESLPIDASEPPPGLVRLYKALGDEGRLRLLRALRERDLSLKDAAESLGVAKSTAHHHLALLRQAGLVWVKPQESGDKVYSLREDLMGQMSQLLQGYLGTG